MSSNIAGGQFHPSTMAPEVGGTGYSQQGFGIPYGYIPVGLGKGTGLNTGVVSGVMVPFQIPYNLTFTTGLTISMIFAEDALNADPGANAYIGVTAGPIVSNTSTLDESTTGPLHASTEVAAAVTLPATTGVLVKLEIAIPNADLNSMAAGEWIALRVRRLGTNVLDTHNGQVVLLGVAVRDT